MHGSYAIISDMKPENSQSPTPGFEQLPAAPYNGAESVPILPMPEVAPLSGQERFEQAAEARAIIADAASGAQVVTPVAPATQPASDATTQASPSTLATPIVAADEDLIEKEWVDKAKEIIEQTKDDPHARTQRVNELQRDYLQKRFGKVVGASE